MSYLETEGMPFTVKLLILQCDYSSPELACKLCVQKGFNCGPKVGRQNRRVLAIDSAQNQSRQTAEEALSDHMVVHEVEEAIRQPFYPDEEVPDLMDSICLEHFWKQGRHRRLDCGVGNLRVQGFLLQRLGFNLSKPVKFAIILATSAYWSRYTHEILRLNEKQTSRCLDLFYR